MNDFEKISQELKELFKLRKYHEGTIDLYTHWLIDLFKFYPTTLPENITEEQINSYVVILVNRKYSYSSINQLFQGVDFFYNQIHKKDIRLNKKLLPLKKELVVDYLLQNQVIQLIDSIQNIKHKSIVALLYSCGLDIKDIIKLKVEDVKSRQKPSVIVVTNSDNTLRRSILSDKLVEILNLYYREYKPQFWFFEGQNKDSQYSLTSARKVVENAFVSQGYTLDYEVKVLQKSYIKHMVELGIPLIVLMQHLGLKSFEGIARYSKMIHGDMKVDFSPLDRVIGKQEIKTEEINDLEKLVFNLKNRDEQEYLIEAISCFRVGALRAGIVFSWSAYTRFIQNKCIEKGFKSINEALHKFNPSAKQIKNKDDFETIRDFTLLSICEELDVISKHQKSQLDNNLDLRNHCGHPSSYNPEINKAKAFLEDIVNLMR